MMTQPEIIFLWIAGNALILALGLAFLIGMKRWINGNNGRR